MRWGASPPGVIPACGNLTMPRQELLQAMGPDEYSALIEWTRIRADGLEQGGSGYAHFVGYNPSA